MAELLFLSRKAVEAAAAPATGRAEFKDTLLPGLYLRVTSAGVRSFSYVGRPAGGPPEHVTLGKYPAVPPEQARARGLAIAAQHAAGVSVAEVLRRQRSELTLAELRHLIDFHAAGAESAPGAHLWDASLWSLYIEPKFGRRRLSEVTAFDVRGWHDALRRHLNKARKDSRMQPDEADRIATWAPRELRSMYTWAADADRVHFCGTNPVPREL